MLGVQRQNIYKGKEVRLKRAARLWLRRVGVCRFRKARA
jgi:hypothetical protein